LVRWNRRRTGKGQLFPALSESQPLQTCKRVPTRWTHSQQVNLEGISDHGGFSQGSEEKSSEPGAEFLIVTTNFEEEKEKPEMLTESGR